MTFQGENTKPVLDRWVFVPLAITVVFGAVAVYDATAVDIPAGATMLGYLSAFYSQLLYGAVGLALLALLAFSPARLIDRLTTPFFVITVAACLALFIPGVGVEAGKAVRWLKIGPITLQPSEFLKPALALMLARLLARPGLDIRASWRSLAPAAAVLGFCFFIVERQPDMGTGLVLLSIGFGMAFLAGARLSHLGAGALGMAGFLVLAIKVLHFRSGRIPAFLDPEGHRYGTGFQIVHSLVAVCRGGLSGVGFGLGLSKTKLPVAGSDYLFATIAEELGMLGCVAVLGALIFVILRLLLVASRAPMRRMRLAAGGICLGLAAQTLLNVAVVTNCLPSTGVPLPFISDGGSSMIAGLMSVGIVLSLGQGRAPRTAQADEQMPHPATRRGAAA